MIRRTQWLGGVIAAAALLTLSSPVWAQSRPSVGTITNTAPLGITPPFLQQQLHAKFSGRHRV